MKIDVTSNELSMILHSLQLKKDKQIEQIHRFEVSEDKDAEFYIIKCKETLREINDTLDKFWNLYIESVKR